MIFLDIQTFFGRLHPLLVHLPIGFLVLGFLFEVLSYFKIVESLKSVTSIILLVTGLSAFVSCVFGWLLSTTGDYDIITLENHKIGGIVFTVICFVLWALQRNLFAKYFTFSPKVFTGVYLVLVLFLSYVGHQGGNLTHGSTYLTLDVLTEKERVPPKNLDEAMVFEDVIQPILQKKCVQCHQKSKMKGDLNLKDLDGILKGGKNGSTFVKGDPAKSELIHRITMDPSEKEFMPTDGKTPLTKNEIKILEYWIKSIEPTLTRKVVAQKMPDDILQLVEVQLGFKESVEATAAFKTDVKGVIDNTKIESLRNAGFSVRLMYLNPTILDVRLMNTGGTLSRESLAQKLQLLASVAENVVWLNLSGLGLKNDDTRFLSKFKNLEKLRLENNDLEDSMVGYLKDLKYLNALNLNKTKVSKQGLSQLLKLENLKSIYVFESLITPKDTSGLTKAAGQTQIVL